MKLVFRGKQSSFCFEYIWVILVTFGYFSLPCWQTNKLCVLYRISDSFATLEDGKSPKVVNDDDGGGNQLKKEEIFCFISQTRDSGFSVQKISDNPEFREALAKVKR